MQHASPHHFARSYHAGLSAEDSAARCYRAEGGALRAKRWRCPEGEIDLVVELPGEIVFVEVKARRGGPDRAARAVSPRQWARIGAAATRYLAEQTDGTIPCRFDLALVDGMGRLERIENAASFDDW
jgi:putative endonuclease